ncbi:M14 family zinc carboxypeptidase [Variovorax saccharolyticus]|uniref:M14 family zinc carboxypeptidase n=1 Tax=Variovorax saccharolyticus TaxID=3053516 RepID=UPI002578314C|nr:M14 family zinc carboxypeptidase [Variovorax sp. J31P216]MDM0025390.1 M14 family zinc carboxypeptidase [Variovorax sp. J31P216]
MITLQGFSSVTPTELPELEELQQLAELGAPWMERRLLCEVDAGERRFPVHAYVLGSQRPDAPAVGIFGGVHGLERIGAEVAIAYLRSIVMRLQWDLSLHRMLESMRLVFVPLVNPGGLWLGTRANPRGVDLMRNAPVDSTERVPYLIGGQRISAALPWYRGAKNAQMECESAALCRIVESELLARPFSISVDCHSGFGMSDRVWFPFAHTGRPIAHLPEVHAFAEILDQTLPHHRYVLEPQSRQYLTHGDLWDHLYMSASQRAGTVFLPMTLEMGSWLWVRKNPLQFFSRAGIFNPVIEHRRQRVLRRHVGWLDFVTRAVCSHERWVPARPQRAGHRASALARWYGARA